MILKKLLKTEAQSHKVRTRIKNWGNKIFSLCLCVSVVNELLLFI